MNKIEALQAVTMAAEKLRETHKADADQHDQLCKAICAARGSIPKATQQEIADSTFPLGGEGLSRQRIAQILDHK